MIYLDYASTRRPYDEAIAALCDSSLVNWMNPSNIYDTKAKETLEWSKRTIAETLGCKSSEIYFTSGASEGNAVALWQRAETMCSVFEHPNYKLNPSTEVVSEDWVYEVEDGNYCDTAYAHMLVSNETGNIFTVWNQFKRAKELGMLTICDITQAYANMPIYIYDIGCDIAIASGHKFGGPRGTGFMFIKEGTEMTPLIHGTQGLKGGTENVAGWYAMAVAAKIGNEHLSDKMLHCFRIKKAIKAKLEGSGIDYIEISDRDSVPSTFTFALKGIESEILQTLLADECIYIGVGSACCDGSMSVSEGLKALGVSEDYIHGPVRLSYGLETKIEDVEKAMDRLIAIYKEVTCK